MRRIIFFLIFINFVLATTSYSQVALTVIPEFKKTVKHKFTNEWQYLSTDLYLFNPERFENLINEIIAAQKGKQTKNKELIESILITTDIKGLTLNLNVSLPIFQFIVSYDKSADKYTSKINSTEVLRLIDNVPVVNPTEFVEAIIKTDVITEKTRDKVLKFIASQLQNIGSITGNPSTAVINMVGEFGKMLDNNIKNKQYNFENTIRLYEEQNFSQRVHSINLFVFAPFDTKRVFLDTTKFAEFIDSSDNPKITRNKILELIKYKKYPFIVIVNYKSKYMPDQILGDEITAESVEVRKVKTKNAFNSKLINNDVYTQETKLNEFLEAFVQLKLDINIYKLTYNNQITDDFSKTMYFITRSYKNLRTIYDSRNVEFKNNASYNNEFKPIYESILLNSELYLDGDNNLKNVKELVKTIFEWKHNPYQNPDSLAREVYLGKLYSYSIPESEKSTDEYQTIETLKQKIEKTHYNQLFKSKVDILNSLAPLEENLVLRDQIKNLIKNTNCRLCRNSVNEAILNFNIKYQENSRLHEINKFDGIRKSINNEIFFLLKRENCIQTKINQSYPGDVPAHIQLVKDELNVLINKRQILQDELKKEISQSKLQEITDHSDRVQNLIQEINNGYKGICAKIPDMCNCD